MANSAIDTIRVGSTDYEISDPHALYGTHDESAPNLTDNPLYVSDIATTQQNDQTKPAGANVAYEMQQQINTINSDIANMPKTKNLTASGLSFTANTAIDLGTIASVIGITGITFDDIKGLSLLMAGGNLNYDFGHLYAVKTNNHFYYWPSTTQAGGYLYFAVTY